MEESPLLKVQTAWLFLVAGIIIIAIIPHIFPTILDLFVGETDGSTMVGIFEFGLLTVQLMLMILLPAGIITRHILTQVNNSNPVKEVGIAIIILIFGLLLTYFGYNWISGFASVMEGTFTITLYWIGLIITWLGTIVLAPIQHIIKVSKL